MEAKNRSQAYLEVILGDPSKVEISIRILRAAIFCSALVAGAIFVTTFLLRLELVTLFTTGAALFINALLYHMARKGRYVTPLTWIFLGMNFLLVLQDWLFVGGLSGLGLSIIVVLCGIMPLLLPRKAAFLGIFSILVLYSVLFLLTLLPGIDLPQPDPSPKYVADRVFDSMFLAMGLALMTGLVMASYRRQEREIHTLRGIIPICAYCKKIRNDEGFYEALEDYIKRNSEADFSHTYCPDCMEQNHPEFAAKRREGLNPD